MLDSFLEDAYELVHSSYPRQHQLRTLYAEQPLGLIRSLSSNQLGFPLADPHISTLLPKLQCIMVPNIVTQKRRHETYYRLEFQTRALIHLTYDVDPSLEL